MVKLFSILVVRKILKLFWIFPIARNKIVFICYDGTRYTCNPKYLYEYMQNDSCDWDYVWVCKHTAFEFNTNAAAFNTQVVSQNTFSYFYHCLTATVFVTNDGVSSVLPFRRSQTIINTWHGGGVYKSSGLGGNSRLSPSDQLSITNMSKTLDWFVSSSEAFSVNMNNFYLIPDRKFLPTGMPRNDIFFDTYKHEEVQKRVRSDLGISNEFSIALYTPTFRGSARDTGYHQNELEADRVLEALQVKFDKKFKLVYRVHHAAERPVLNEDIIDGSDYPDIQHLLLASDVLISDYSSILWDFSLTLKPALIFAPDLKDYQTNDRGFTSEIGKWPFPVAQDMDEIVLNIDTFDEAHYARAVRSHHDELGSYEKGDACATITDLINNVTLD